MQLVLAEAGILIKLQKRQMICDCPCLNDKMFFIHHSVNWCFPWKNAYCIAGNFQGRKQSFGVICKLKFSPQNLGVWQYFVAPASILQKIFHKINNFAMIWKIWSKIGIPLVARQTYDNAFGLSIMIFTASSKITSLPKDINRLHLAASSALKFAYTTSKGTTGSNIPI